MTTRRTPDLGWRTQAYMLEEGTYEFDVEAVEGDDGAGYVLRLRVAGGPLEGHRILVKEASPIAGLRVAMTSGAHVQAQGVDQEVARPGTTVHQRRGRVSFSRAEGCPIGARPHSWPRRHPADPLCRLAQEILNRPRQEILS